MKKPSEAINIVNLDHLGIVAGIIDEMELVEEVNKKVGLKTKETVSPGQVMKAMILNGLGFLSAPIYLFDTLYTAPNLSAMVGMKWITRVPLSIKEAQNKIWDIEDNAWEPNQIKGYKIAAISSEYANIKQRWLVIESEIRKQAALKKISEQVEKQLELAKASLRKLFRQEFACITDAEMAIKRLSESWKYHQIAEIEYLEKPVKKMTIKPKIESQTKPKVYQITGKIETRLSVIEAERVKAGRFILATNILDTKTVSNEQVLEEYKAQQSNERGFRFIKDPLFFTSSVFVKKPERVEAIGMIMGLCLLVYNLII